MQNLRFEFRVLTEDGETVVSDYATISADRIDQFGGCEVVDHAVASGMRAVRRDFIEWLARELSEDDCPGHVAAGHNPKICGRCGTHVEAA
jgi:hypothetical protein